MIFVFKSTLHKKSNSPTGQYFQILKILPNSEKKQKKGKKAQSDRAYKLLQTCLTKKRKKMPKGA